MAECIHGLVACPACRPGPGWEPPPDPDPAPDHYTPSPPDHCPAPEADYA